MERTYVIPLRREFQKAPIYKRTKRAVAATKTFLKKNMKMDDIKLGRHLNMVLWARGNRNPPHKVEVSAEVIKDKDGDYVYAELVGVEKEQLKVEVVEKKEGLAGKVQDLVGGKPKEEKQKTEQQKKVEKQKEEEKKVKEKVLKEVPLEKEAAKEILGDKDSTKEEKEKARQENMIKRDMKKSVEQK